MTSFMTLLAGFQILMTRYSGQSDLLVGTPVANRNHPMLERVIGFFVNTLAIRARFGDNPAFAVFLERLRTTALDAFANQDAPFERVVETAGIARATDRSPLVQVVFAYQSEMGAELNLPGLSSQMLAIETQSSKFDMVVSLTEKNGVLEGLVEYDHRSILTTRRIVRMMRHYRNLLERAAADPDQPVKRIDFLGHEEREKQLFEWSQTESPFDLNRFFPRSIWSMGRDEPGPLRGQL